MISSRFAFACALGVLSAASACQGQQPAPAKTKAASAPAVSAPAPVPVVDAPATVPAVVQAPAPVPEPVPAPETNPSPDPGLGQQLVDPRWFRKTLFGDKGKVLDTKRSDADDQGRFSSFIRFELEGMSTTECADHLSGLVAEDIPSPERSDTDGRIQVTGNTAEYKVTFVCGEAEGKTIAYVSYAWT